MAGPRRGERRSEQVGEREEQHLLRARVRARARVVVLSLGFGCGSKRRTTTTSIRMVTVREMVVKGPCAFISEMMAMADEGERATARHEMSSAAASWSPKPSAPA